MSRRKEHGISGLGVSLKRSVVLEDKEQDKTCE